MQDLGAPSSYLAVRPGVPVFSSDEVELGRVVRVMSQPNIDMFDGVVFDTTRNQPGGHRFVDAPEVAAIYDNGIVLSINAAAAAELAPPGKNPGALRVNPDDLVGRRRSAMGRFWDRLSGKG